MNDKTNGIQLFVDGGNFFRGEENISRRAVFFEPIQLPPLLGIVLTI